MKTMMKAEHVSISYKIGDFKDIGLKEWTMRHLKNQYRVETFMAVQNVSFELMEGDMLGIIGTNGAGKSTLLKAVIGVMEPREGHIERNGNISALLELASGFDGDLTVKENAYLRGAMLGYTKAFMDETYEQILDFSELREFEDRPFKQLSTGMQSRLAFSIASLVKPEILILDEVLSVGDGAFQEKSARKMREIIDSGAATILVSHSLAQVREMCNKVLWLERGQQIAYGETKEICDRYEAFLTQNTTPFQGVAPASPAIETGIENPPETVPINLTVSPEPEHSWQKEQERKLAAIARELMRVKWKQIDQIGPPDKDTVVTCGICGTAASASQLETLVSQCIFAGGELIRYRCPGCGAIFGPVKFSRLNQEESDDDYIVHFTGYNEGDSTVAELYTFELLNPRKDGVYLNYGCGRWTSTLEILRQRGYQVYGYEPYAGNASIPNLITDRQTLSTMRFDGIFTNNLIENLRDPVSELRFMKTLLASPEAKMAHTTPCYRYLYECTRFCTFFFTGRSLDVLCEKVGLRVVQTIDGGEERGIHDFHCKIFEVKEG